MPDTIRQCPIRMSAVAELSDDRVKLMRAQPPTCCGEGNLAPGIVDCIVSASQGQQRLVQLGRYPVERRIPGSA